MTDAAGRRFAELCRALAALAVDEPGIEEVPVDGDECSLRLRSEEGAVSTLVVARGSVTVTTRSAADHPEAGEGDIQDRLGVDLREGWSWDDARCASATELARLLVKHMRRRLDHADPDPGKVEDR